MGESPAIHGILLGASPAVRGASNIRLAYCQSAAGDLFSADNAQSVGQPDSEPLPAPPPGKPPEATPKPKESVVQGAQVGQRERVNAAPFRTARRLQSPGGAVVSTLCAAWVWQPK